jgi:hypothetical protein
MRATDFSSRDFTKFRNWANLVACHSWLLRVNLLVVVILLTSLHVDGGPCNRLHAYM